jgi:hypothetical protein
MSPLILAPILELGGKILDRLFPDATERARAERDFLMLMQEQDLKKVLAQLEVNAREAQSPHLFVSGWRPGAGWTSVAGLAYAAILQPLLTWLSAIKGWPAPPMIDSDTLLYVLGGMLGLGALRSVEKAKGVTR